METICFVDNDYFTVYEKWKKQYLCYGHITRSLPETPNSIG